MSKRQIEVCTKRLQAVSGYEAAQFKVLMRESGEMLRKAFEIRNRAWEIYREALGIQKVEK